MEPSWIADDAVDGTTAREMLGLDRRQLEYLVRNGRLPSDARLKRGARTVIYRRSAIVQLAHERAAHAAPASESSESDGEFEARFARAERDFARGERDEAVERLAAVELQKARSEAAHYKALAVSLAEANRMLLKALGLDALPSDLPEG